MRGGKEAGQPRWLIVKHGVSGLDVLTIHTGGSAGRRTRRHTLGVYPDPRARANITRRSS